MRLLLSLLAAGGGAAS